MYGIHGVWCRPELFILSEIVVSRVRIKQAALAVSIVGPNMSNFPQFLNSNEARDFALSPRMKNLNKG